MIDTASIKKQIIDLAVSGKLSSTFSAHDTVNDIIHGLPDIPSKRRKMFSQQYEYGELYEIPSHWQWLRLGQIASYGDASSKATINDLSEDTWVLDLEDILAGGEIIEKVHARERQFIGEKVKFTKGQILYSKLRPYLMKVLVADDDGVSTSELVSFNVFGNILPQYVVFFLLGSFANRAINKRSYGVKMPRVDTAFMVNLPIPIPPISEQQFIVQKVQEINEQIAIIDALQTKYQSNLSSLKSKLIDAAFQGKLTKQLPEDGTAEELYQQIQQRKLTLEQGGKNKKSKPVLPISDKEKPFDIPDNWKWVRIKDVYEINPMVTAEDNINAAFIPMEKISAGFDRSFSYEIKKWSEASKNHTRFCNGDVAFAKISPCFENRKSFVVANLPNSLGGGTTELIILRQKLIDPLFTYYLILDERFIRLGLSTYKGTVGQQRIKNDVMLSYVFPLPPLAEQKRIVAKLEELLPLCAE